MWDIEGGHCTLTGKTYASARRPRGHPARGKGRLDTVIAMCETATFLSVTDTCVHISLEIPHSQPHANMLGILSVAHITLRITYCNRANTQDMTHLIAKG